MEHNSLTGIASARPIIYAEGLFAPCILENGKFIPEEGLSQRDLWSILNGEFFKSGSDLIEGYTLNSKLEKLSQQDSSCYELEYFPKEKVDSSASSEETDDTSPSNIPLNRSTDIVQNEDIPLLRINTNDSEGQNHVKKASSSSDRIKDFFEKQITWLLEEDEGEDFVIMEMCSRFKDTLVLLDLLKQHNIPCVLSFLAKRDEPVTISFSKIHIGLECLMFCLFQA